MVSWLLSTYIRFRQYTPQNETPSSVNQLLTHLYWQHWFVLWLLQMLNNGIMEQTFHIGTLASSQIQLKRLTCWSALGQGDAHVGPVCGRWTTCWASVWRTSVQSVSLYCTAHAGASFKDLCWMLFMTEEMEVCAVMTCQQLDLSLLLCGFADSATKRQRAATAATWCAATVDTTPTLRNWWSAATANTTGAATSPARSVKGW